MCGLRKLTSDFSRSGDVFSTKRDSGIVEPRTRVLFIVSEVDMWSKAPRHTGFEAASQVPGPGAYNPKDVKKTASATVPFGKQTER